MAPKHRIGTFALLLVASAGYLSCSSSADESANASLFPLPPSPECETFGTGHLSVWNTGPARLRVTVSGGARGRVTATIEPNILGASTSLELDMPVGDYQLSFDSPRCPPVRASVKKCVSQDVLVRCDS